MDEKQDQNDNKSTDLVPIKKEGFFKRIWNKIKNFVIREEKVEKVGDERPVNTERDTFLEGLRKHVDIEYKEGIKAENVAKEKEAHKARTTKNDNEREI